MTDRELLLQIYTALENERAAERSEGKPTGGFVPRPGTWAWQRRVAAAAQDVQLAMEAIRARLAEPEDWVWLDELLDELDKGSQ